MTYPLFGSGSAGLGSVKKLTERLLCRHRLISVIANTTTRTGLRIRAHLDRRNYPTGVKVTDEQLATVRISKDSFHVDWNYRIESNQS